MLRIKFIPAIYSHSWRCLAPNSPDYLNYVNASTDISGIDVFVLCISQSSSIAAIESYGDHHFLIMEYKPALCALYALWVDAIFTGARTHTAELAKRVQFHPCRRRVQY